MSKEVKANVLLMFPNNQTATMLAMKIVNEICNVDLYLPEEVHEQVMPSCLEEILLESVSLDVRKGFKISHILGKPFLFARLQIIRYDDG